ncbi:RNA polymerase sigma factor [Actinacidiphila sp. ITFR-21]|uniref:RNA polymerase sigma factor n=1 Tax=Actinacidiphila sp. ITFR-21 TaxID=3075199 RepID=UPI0028894D8C|nr:sigma-70 family RNA polymerase sigma factor [Streptomyces sp. ITFR-21]WNI16932.1 sigma-70 family RNA polymerase sigma factor [Streptomyces sp. ITFR-21]
MDSSMRHVLPDSTPPAANADTICPECKGPLSSGHQCPPKTTEELFNELFTAAYAEHRAMVRWTIIGRLSARDDDLAEDLVQETFLALFRYRERIEFGPRVGGLLRVMAKQAVGRHYRLMRNTREVPADTGHWSFANRALVPAGAGTLKPLGTDHPDDSDPDPDEALRQGRQLAGAR